MLEQVSADLAGDEFATALTFRIRRAIRDDGTEAELAALENELRERERKIDRLADAVADTEEPAALLRTIEKMEREKNGIALRSRELQHQAAQMKGLREISDRDV